MSEGSMVWWDLQTVPPPPNYQFMDHLLASHRALGTGLYSFCPPVKLRAHGTEPLADAAYDYIVKSELLLQQSISPGSEQGSSRCWKAMVVDMLLWATDHAPGKADLIIISKVFDRTMADVIHQLHTRNYNILLATSFPPKDMTPLRQCAPPPNCKLLRQIFLLLNVTNDVRTTNTAEEPLIAGENPDITRPRPKLATVTVSYEPITMEEVKNWLQELVACGRADAGINLSLLGADFAIHKGKKLNYKNLGCPTLMVLLSKFGNLVQLERRESMVLLFPRNRQGNGQGNGARSTMPERPFCLPTNCIPGVPMRLTSLPRIIQVPGQISIRKSIHTTVPPVPKFPMESNTTMKSPAPPVPKSPMESNTNMKSPAPPVPKSPMESITTMKSPAPPVPIFPMESNTTMKPPAAKTANTIIRPRNSAPPTPDVQKVMHPPVESYFECRGFRLPKVEVPAPSSIGLGAQEPEPPQISMASEPVITPRTDPVRVASTAPSASSEINTAMPSVDAAVPTLGTAKENLTPDGEDPQQGTSDDAGNGNGEKFNMYSVKVIQEREAIKRTFDMVKKRLQEEHKRRRLAQ